MLAMAEPTTVEAWLAAARAADDAEQDLAATRAAFLDAHADDIYASLQADARAPLRADALVALAAERFPGLVATPAEVAADARRPLAQKTGVERSHAQFFAALLESPRAGCALLAAMARPRPESAEQLAGYRARGHADLGVARVERRGAVGHVFLTNDAYLNAEDDDTNRALETAIDLVLLDPASSVGVLRGGRCSHPRYAGAPVFSAGINLTALYEGRISYMFFLERELGYVSKLYRGLSAHGDEPAVEKPWIAAVERFAIGGGCQLLLVMDHVIAERGARITLPAGREGIIPGASNLRLTRSVGPRLARQLLYMDAALVAGSPQAAALCDEVVEADEIEAAIGTAAARLCSGGLLSVAANRLGLRLGEEPLEDFRRYMAFYAREQADCLLSPQLVANLERNWIGRARERDGEAGWSRGARTRDGETGWGRGAGARDGEAERARGARERVGR